MKKKIILIFGGKSYEHDISIKSAKSILKYINKNKYDITLIYITKNGEWSLCKNINKLDDRKSIVDNSIFKDCYCVFPILHGNNGEDGKIQGYFDMINVPYVGCNLISSALCMDKAFTKIVLDNIGIKQAKYIIVNKNDYNIDRIKAIIKEEIKYPCFIKPANAGSSVGINKVYHEHELLENINGAFNYDEKIIIEECIYGRELEVGILGNNDIIVSNVGEILPADDFYSYDAKYNSKDSIVKIPAIINSEIKTKIKEIAKQAYKALECSGLSRIDFFLKNDSNEIYLNEINTMPGFTNISMYPLLFENVGIKYETLIDKLIDLGRLKYEKKVI
ncbi:MAG: D-alanine--D-alanine ligase [Firmicutes bacterium]|nr:D-alanine--D-alanine ligase [Bacillota bacterium]